MLHDPLMILFLLLCGHALCDFGLQSPALATAKRAPAPMWYGFLTAHALMHGGAVALITGNAWLGIAETVAHWLIDFGKCRGLYGMPSDQAMHFICKAVWFGLWYVYAPV